MLEPCYFLQLPGLLTLCYYSLLLLWSIADMFDVFLRTSADLGDLSLLLFGLGTHISFPQLCLGHPGPPFTRSRQFQRDCGRRSSDGVLVLPLMCGLSWLYC